MKKKKLNQNGNKSTTIMIKAPRGLISQNVLRPGRPRKNGPGLAPVPPEASSSQPPAKRGPGRPRKNGASSQAEATKKRPRKNNK